MNRMKPLAILVSATLLGACGGTDPDVPQVGANPKLPEQQSGLLPDMAIASPAAWGNARPAVPAGYTITAIAIDLAIPRQTLILPNGDILVAEGRGGADEPKLRPKDFVAGRIKAKGTSPVKAATASRCCATRTATASTN